MDKFDYYEVARNLENTMQEFSNTLSEMMKNIKINISVDTFQSLIEFFQNIPDNVKDTELFHSIQKLDKPNLRYEDIIWLLEEYGIENFEVALNGYLENVDKSNDVHNYLKTIILNDNVGKREKVVILLAHIETLIYDTLNCSKKPRVKLKTTVRQIAIDNNNDMSLKSLGMLFVLGILYVVFANTDSYTEDIDKRMPFRNNILHNGIVLYSDEDIEMVYSLLIIFLFMLLQLKKKIVADD